LRKRRTPSNIGLSTRSILRERTINATSKNWFVAKRSIEYKNREKKLEPMESKETESLRISKLPK